MELLVVKAWLKLKFAENTQPIKKYKYLNSLDGSTTATKLFIIGHKSFAIQVLSLRMIL